MFILIDRHKLGILAAFSVYILVFIFLEIITYQTYFPIQPFNDQPTISITTDELLMTKEKDLGNFSWVSGGIRYKFNGYLRQVNFTSGKVEWRVVGQSGDSGFGYSFITKKNTLGKRARMQIFQQIIDKYNLQKYI